MSIEMLEVMGATPFISIKNIAATTPKTTLVDGVSGKRIYVHKIILESTPGAEELEFTFGYGTSTTATNTLMGTVAGTGEYTARAFDLSSFGRCPAGAKGENFNVNINANRTDAPTRVTVIGYIY